MNILVPLNQFEYIDPYIDAGADELYFGFYDHKWEERFGEYSDINRMSGFGKSANSYSFHEILQCIDKIKQRKKRAFVTINANGYTKNQISYMEEYYFPKLINAGVDGVILSDIDEIIAAVDKGLHPVASTMCAIYNTDIARTFFNLGVKRMILPRDLSLDELSVICRKMPDVEFEAFFMRNGCIFSDCFCLGMHRPECGATCTFTRYCRQHYEHDFKNFEDHHDVDVNDYLYRTAYHINACGMCSLYKLNEIGISSLKIVGRADNCQAVCDDIRITRRNIAIMKESSSEKEYLDHMIFPLGFPGICRMGISCYYPESRFDSVT